MDGGLGGWRGAAVVVEVGGSVLRCGGDVGVVVVEQIWECRAWIVDVS